MLLLCEMNVFFELRRGEKRRSIVILNRNLFGLIAALQALFPVWQTEHFKNCEKNLNCDLVGER